MYLINEEKQIFVVLSKTDEHKYRHMTDEERMIYELAK